LYAAQQCCIVALIFAAAAEPYAAKQVCISSIYAICKQRQLQLQVRSVAPCQQHVAPTTATSSSSSSSN
jgi:hypothetical protein